MVTTSLMTTDRRFESLAARIAGELVSARLASDGFEISTPVLFPSGTHVVVKVVSTGRERFLVTDDGAAAFEAEMMGVTGRAWAKAARLASTRNGIRFNEHELFEIDAPADRLAGFIAIVADAARYAIDLAAQGLAEKLERAARASILDVLVEAFGSSHVTREARLQGASSHLWEFDALAAVGNVKLAFAVTSPAPQSVSANYMKLDDLRRVEDAPRTVAALTDMKLFGSDQLVILGRSAKLLDVQAPVAEFRALAKAA